MKKLNFSNFNFFIKNAIRIAGEETYYPELNRKSKLVRIIENIRWLFKYKRYNEYYNAYGLDVKGRMPSSEYLDDLSFLQFRKQLLSSEYSQNILVKDKLLFYRYMQEIGIPTPSVFAVIFGDEVLDLNFQPIDIDDFKKRKNYFIKDIYGGSASCVMRICDFEEYNEKKEDIFSKGRFLREKRFLVQEGIKQHDKMQQLNPYGVNTLRLVTTIDKYHKVRLLSTFLRIGTSKSNAVDNWSKGGLAVRIGENGYLKEYGFYKPNYGTKTQIHPDTKIEFKSFQIPHYTQAVEAAINAHKYFYDLPIIGWDIVITENGCTFLEGNDGLMFPAMQVCDRPLKKEWLDLLKTFR
jgi:hypothetical protein